MIESGDIAVAMVYTNATPDGRVLIQVTVAIENILIPFLQEQEATG